VLTINSTAANANTNATVGIFRTRSCSSAQMTHRSRSSCSRGRAMITLTDIPSNDTSVRCQQAVGGFVMA
jgi:hypothetical protein